MGVIGIKNLGQANGETKRPQPNTLNIIMEYINGKYINVKISKSNLYAGGKHKINQGGVYNDAENTKELITHQWFNEYDPWERYTNFKERRTDTTIATNHSREELITIVWKRPKFVETNNIL